MKNKPVICGIDLKELDENSKRPFLIFGQFHTKTATVPRKGYIRESPYVRSTVLCGALKNGVFRYAVPF